jgi:hypothetical protein
MKVRAKNIFTTVRAEGAILPTDLLQRIVDNDNDLDGLTPAAYHLLEGEKLNEAINRSWSRLRGAWASFQGALERLPESDAATKVTRDRILLPLFQELGYGRLTTTRAIEIEGKAYPISHLWQNTPIHLVGYRVDLDKRTAGVAGAARSSPHSLVQEFLNRSDDHLWAFVSNGRRLRILRDNASLTRQAYVEFDLEAMMAGEVYADFVLLWLLCHQSRVEAEKPEQCWLEVWSKTADDQGKRALDALRDGVEAAIASLGQGFLTHSANRTLRHKLQSGELPTQDYYRQLLRLVYRLLFLFVAEDRELLLDPNAEPAAKDRYTLYYSTARLRTLAEKRRGTRHSDLFHGLRLVMEKLSSRSGCPELALPALNGFLWSEEATSDLEVCQIANLDLLKAVRALAFITDQHGRRAVDYKNLQSEELGSVYESLLELQPELNISAGTFELKTVGGNERKTTGSYYTPDSLVQCLLDSALDPVLDEAVRQPDPEAAILALRVCDPACGSGHFLIAAAHRIAKRLAAVRTGDEEPAPEARYTAIRDVIGYCIYGVDINPMAVELCKVALCMEAVEPGRPLPFIEHHIRQGNSLLNATPRLIGRGIPDEAFKPIEGDDKSVCSQFRKRNKKEREKQQLTLVDPAQRPWEWLEDVTVYAPELQPWKQLEEMAARMEELDDLPGDTLADIYLKQQKHRELLESTEYKFTSFRADVWCSAFVMRKVSDFEYLMTEEVFRKIKQNPLNAPKWLANEVAKLKAQYHFFHWHVAFPHIFQVPKHEEEAHQQEMGWSGGFDVVLGNPPWEKLQTEELQFFAARNPAIASLRGAIRKLAIKRLQEVDPSLASAWAQQRRFDAAMIGFIRNSKSYPLTGVGKFNTFALFSEQNRKIASEQGRIGCIVPSGIATDDTTKLFFQDLIKKSALISLYDFENREEIFTGVHRSYKFCLLTLHGSVRNPEDETEMVFFALQVEDIRNPEKNFTLSTKDFLNLNPNTLTCPTFRFQKDAEINKSIYRKIPVLLNESSDVKNFYKPKVWRLLNTTDDSSNFVKLEDGYIKEGIIPVIEAKMIHQFDHRFSIYESDKNSEVKTRETSILEKENPDFLSTARHYIKDFFFRKRIAEEYCDKGWFFTARNIARSTDERTVISAILPKVASCEMTPYIEVGAGIESATFLCGVLNSFVLDYAARQKVGGTHLSYFILYQLPVVAPAEFDVFLIDFFANRVLELTYTSWDLQPFAQDCGYEGPPFKWDEDRRFLLRCELDAAYFHLYGIQRDDVDYIMETFPIVKRKDEKAHGHYRTKDTILQIYDAMATAIASGQPYQTLLNPPPADPRVAHPPREPGIRSSD